MRLPTRLPAILTAALSLALVPATAGVITSFPGGWVVPMPVVEYYGTGPETFGPGITWSSTNATNQGGSVFGYTGQYSFIANGQWIDYPGTMAGLNNSYTHSGDVDWMTFTFANPVSEVGGFIDYAPDSLATTIAAYDAHGVLIESDELTFSTGGAMNSGQFLGFQESAPIISQFVLTNGYVGLTDLTVPAPEPGTLFPAAAALVALAGLLRRGIRA